MIAFKLLLVIATAGSFITAYPEPTAAPDLEQRAIDCAKINGALSILKKVGPPATSFCSSYLKIPATKLTTALVVSTTTTTEPVTTTTVTRGYCSPGSLTKRNARINYRDFEEVKPVDTPVENAEKRTDNILPLLAAFAAAKVSEGCSCLNIQPRATSTTTVFTSTTTVRVFKATATACKEDPSVCIQLGELCPYGKPNRCCAGKCTGIVNDADPAICFISSSGN